MKAEGRFRLLAFFTSVFMPLLLVACFPMTQYLSYDLMANVKWAVREVFSEVLGPPPTLHPSIVLLGERDTVDLSGATRAQLEKEPLDFPRELAIYNKLLLGGAAAVVADKNYSEAEHNQLMANRLEEATRLIVPVNKVVGEPVDLGRQPQGTAIGWDFPIDKYGKVRSVYLALRTKEGQWTPTVPLVLLADFLRVPLEQVAYSSTFVKVGKSEIPVCDDGKGLAYWLDLYDARNTEFDFSDSNFGFETQSLYPVTWQDLHSDSHGLFRKASGRYFFQGDYRHAALKERSTPMGKYEDFTLLAVSLDSLIRSAGVRWLPWWMQLACLIVWNGLVIAVLFRQRTALRLSVSFILLAFLLLFLLQSMLLGGIYLPGVQLLFSFLLLGVLAGLRLWISAVHLLHRFGGRAAAAGSRWGFESTFSDIDERWATILFVNLPEHLKILERVNAPELFPRRKEFSSMVTRVAHDLGGIIHDYQADALMIGFGTDVLHRDPRHAFKAVRAARTLQDEFKTLVTQWTMALRQEDYQPEQFEMYAGICSGEVAVGFVGASHYKKAPAAIGDTTNVAARLLGAAKKQHVSILISKPTYEACASLLQAESLPPVKLKGKTHPVEVYQVLDLQGAWPT